METRTKVKKSLWNFIDSRLSYLVGETEVGDKDPHREEWRIILPTAELRFDWFLYGDKCVDLGLGRSFCMVRSLTVSALPVGGKVQWILLTHPGGALCLTSDKGTNVFKTRFSSMLSFFILLSSLKIPKRRKTSHLKMRIFWNTVDVLKFYSIQCGTHGVKITEFCSLDFRTTACRSAKKKIP